MKSEQTVIWPGYSVWIKDTILCETAIMQALFLCLWSENRTKGSEATLADATVWLELYFWSQFSSTAQNKNTI